MQISRQRPPGGFPQADVEERLQGAASHPPVLAVLRRDELPLQRVHLRGPAKDKFEPN